MDYIKWSTKDYGIKFVCVKHPRRRIARGVVRECNLLAQGLRRLPPAVCSGVVNTFKRGD